MNQEPEFTEIVDVEDDLDIGQSAVSPQELYDELLKHDRIIVTIPSDQLGMLRKGISNAKYLMNQRLEKAGMPIDARRITFEKIDSDTDGTIRVRIAFKVGQLTVISIEKERI